MKRDIDKIIRDLEDRKNNDIIWKKQKLRDIFKADPDLMDVLGVKEKMPLNKFVDKSNPTEEELKERQEILYYNEKISHEQIVPYLKLNGIQKEVLNFIMFDIDDKSVSYTNNVIKTQELIVMCLVHEDDIDTEYGICRQDLLSYIVKDLLCWTNDLGARLKPTYDFADIIDSKYYCRTLKFSIETVNALKYTKGGNVNRYDRL